MTAKSEAQATELVQLAASSTAKECSARNTRETLETKVFPQLFSPSVFRLFL